MTYYTGIPFSYGQDNAEDRKAAYNAAKQYLKGIKNSMFFEFLNRVIDITQNTRMLSSKKLDNIELSLLGEVVTDGTLPKRIRFYKFLSYNMRGIIPKDIQE